MTEQKVDPTASAGDKIEVARDAVSFLIPSRKTPLLVADLLHGAFQMNVYADCSFVLLLDRDDPRLLEYLALAKRLNEEGMKVGYFVFDGTPYCGKINRVAPIINADFICVIDGSHLPVVADGKSFAETVRKWRAESVQDMLVGKCSEDGFYPVVSQKLVDRLGYMFHPLCYGRLEAENWLLSIGEGLGVVSNIPGGMVIESSVDAVEIVGTSSEDDSKWVDETLDQALEDELVRLGDYLVR